MHPSAAPSPRSARRPLRGLPRTALLAAAVLLLALPGCGATRTMLYGAPDAHVPPTARAEAEATKTTLDRKIEDIPLPNIDHDHGHDHGTPLVTATPTPRRERVTRIGGVEARQRDESGDARIEIRHCLIADSDSGIEGVIRTPDQARALAESILARARGGEDFARLIELNTDDLDGDGTYRLVNWTVEREGSERTRRRFGARFGTSVADAAFRLAPGELVPVPYHSRRAKKGWSILQRVR